MKNSTRVDRSEDHNQSTSSQTSYWRAFKLSVGSAAQVADEYCLRRLSTTSNAPEVAAHLPGET
jgi:hypothetical protein